MKQSLAKNYIYNLIYNALNVIVPLFTVPYVTRIILPAQMGVFSTAQSMFTIITIAAQFGVLVYGVREIAMVHDNKTLMLDRVRRIFSTQVATTLIFLIPAVVLPLVIAGAGDVGWVYAISAFLILNATVDISWFYNGLEEFRITITRNIFVKIVAVALIFILVKTKEDILIYTLIYIAAAFFGNLTMFAGLKRFAGTFKIFSAKWIDKTVIKEAVPYMVPMLLTMVFVEISRFFVYGISGEAVTGIYDQALKIVRMMIIITSALVAVATPRMSKLVASKSYDTIREYFVRIFVILAFQAMLVMAGVIIVGDDFVSFFFGAKYGDVAPVLRVFAVYPVVFMLDQCLLVLLLRPLGRTKTMLIAILVSLGVNIGLNVVFVPLWGAIGGALALIIATLVDVAIQIINCHSFIRWQAVIKNFVIVVLAAALTTAILLFVKSRISFSPLVDFFVFGIACAVLYSVVVMVIGKDIRRYTVQYLRRFLSRFRRSDAV